MPENADDVRRVSGIMPTTGAKFEGPLLPTQDAESVRCQLCADMGRSTPAELLATVPMCGERPQYLLCPDCVEEMGEYVEEVRLV